MKGQRKFGIVVASLLLGTFQVSCASSVDTQTTPASTAPVPVIWDDDGSIDGVTALLYFLHHPSYEVRAATISPGIAHPGVFAPNLARLFALLEVEGIPIAAGRETPLAGDNAFPGDWRTASDGFWELDLPNTAGPADERKASQLLIEAIKSSEQPVIIFVSGPLTNVAEALRMDPSIKQDIRTIEVMGGAIRVSGNVQLAGTGSQAAEWNIFVDPVAAREVFSSGVEIHITPLDATDSIEWTEADAAAWEAASAPESSVAAQLLRYTLKDWSSPGVLIWDLVAALNTSNRGLCEWEDLHIDVVLDEGTNEGQTVVVSDQAPNVSACLSPDVSAYRIAAKEVFASP